MIAVALVAQGVAEKEAQAIVVMGENGQAVSRVCHSTKSNSEGSMVSAERQIPARCRC